MPSLLPLLLLAAPGGVDLDGWVRGGVLAVVERDRPDDVLRFDLDTGLDREGYLAPRLDEGLLGIFFDGGGGLRWGDLLAFRLSLGTGVEDRSVSGRRSFSEELEKTGLLREARLEILDPWFQALTLRLGKTRLRVAKGLVLDEYALGGALEVELPPDLQVEVGAWWPGRDLEPAFGPLLLGRASLGFHDASELFVFGATVLDDGGGAEELVRTFFDLITLRRFEDGEMGQLQAELFDFVAHSCTTIDASFTPLWFGGGVDLLVGDHMVNATGVLGRGDGRIRIEGDREACEAALEEVLPDPEDRQRALRALSSTVPTADLELDLVSFAVDLEWRWRATSWLYPGAFFVWLSGEDFDDPEHFTVFQAPAPWVDRPRLFFGAGLGAGLDARNATSAGVIGHGVRAPGLTLLTAPHDRVEIRLLWAWLDADVAGPWSDDRSYGYELDTTLRWDFIDQVSLELRYDLVELDAFYPVEGRWWRASSVLSAEWP